MSTHDTINSKADGTVVMRGIFYNRPEGMFLTDETNIERYRGSEPDDIIDMTKTVKLTADNPPEMQQPATERYSPGYGQGYVGTYFGSMAEVEGSLQSDGSIHADRITPASMAWERWWNKRDSAAGTIKTFSPYENPDVRPELDPKVRQAWLAQVAEAREELLAPEPTFGESPTLSVIDAPPPVTSVDEDIEGPALADL